MGSVLGFSTNRSPTKIGVRTYRVPGTSVLLPVRAEIAPLLIGAAAEFHRTVEPLRTGWNWGYAFRAIRDSIKPSLHSAAIAIDLNAPRHPLGRSGTFSPRQAAQCRAIARKYGLRWGGDYRSRKDEMHFEVNLPRSEALALVRRLQSPARAPAKPAPKPAAPKRPASNPYPVLRLGARGQAVTNAQNALRKDGTYRGKIDGQFGPAMKNAVIATQRKHRLTADGVVGGSTWTVLRKAAHA